MPSTISRRGLERCPLFHSDDAVFADFLHRLGDIQIVHRYWQDGADLRDHLAADGFDIFFSLRWHLHGDRSRLMSIGLAPSPLFTPSSIDGLRQLGVSGAVTGEIGRLAGHFAPSGRPCFSSGSFRSISLATLTPSLIGRGAIRLAEDHVAAARAKRHFHRISDC
jgi:hypothetical protein